MSNVNDNFFDGHYKDIWRSLIPAELTAKEVEFMISHFQLAPGSKVLDLMCGYGRHALGLAKKGISVTAIDNLGDYTNEIQQKAAAEKLPVKSLQADAATYLDGESYDLVICMGNSLQFFEAVGVQRILSNVFNQLKTGGHLLINSWSLAEIAWNSFKGKGWSQVGEVKFLSDSKYLGQPARIETESTMIAADGSTEIKTGIDYIYSLNEIESMLKGAGLQLREVYSIPGRKKFTPGEPRAYIVAEK